jgi:hypothetical protein
MSRIAAWKRLPTHMRVDRRAILVECAMKSASKMDHPASCRARTTCKIGRQRSGDQFDLRGTLGYRTIANTPHFISFE